MSATAERGYDVAVVGSGIIGLGIALAARARGQRVIVFDRGSEPTGASVRNFGHLCFTPQHGIARDFAFASRALWLTLAAEAGVWLRQSGTLVAARHDDELAVLAEFAAMRDDEVELLTAAQAAERMPLAPGTAVGGAFLPLDLQVNPRQAVAAIAAHLARQGVEFRYRTSVGSVRDGRVETSRGAVEAREIIVAANHDLDLLFPDLAEQQGIQRCGLDMLRVSTNLRAPLTAPLLTGWSLVRYGGFTATAAATALRDRLHSEDPTLAALDLNQMYTQLPDGSLIVGDTHYRGTAIAPFQSEASFDALLAITRELFGVTDLRVLERWQGVYASGPNDFLIDQPEPGVSVLAATTGIGMTTGLGLAEHLVAGLLGGGAISSTLKGTA
ncbi:TIGR03364 family FAD-dependent oxidoreductase [Orlajensenia leifsoniae]|uniref:TIGR03364 family FAD-dependent oxidoreductase n=1 Tax=Orlajensenia leifsoniae TaxID=2561933 RepID=A0A4Y9QYA7_9MICO|nr:TIGR03364 family FAD-dependent oxidoreductase [Leifsonia flava]TFV96798.1 TIGR03364 family FAD-dependent oxidoreductase [Leifsonia flava]